MTIEVIGYRTWWDLPMRRACDSGDTVITYRAAREMFVEDLSHQPNPTQHTATYYTQSQSTAVFLYSALNTPPASSQVQTPQSIHLCSLGL